eukprot:6090512-Lingulodinium_polyedra.AAC.1
MKLSKVTESKLVIHPNWCSQQRRIETTEGFWTGRTIFTEGDDVPVPVKTGGGTLLSESKPKWVPWTVPP